MIDVEDRGHQPNAEEMAAYTGIPLFGELCRYMRSEYRATECVQYSGDRVLLGWNLRFKKTGRTLCTVYPRRGHFSMLVVVGQREKARVEAMMPTCSDAFRRVYEETAEGMGQRWLLLDFSVPTDAYSDALRVIRIRRES